MEVRISFRSDIVLQGETMAEIKDKWENLQLYSDEASRKGMEFLEIDALEDANSNKDLRKEWDKAY